ncbi:MAG: sugar phosphate isomerase/epimerase [Pseudomonadota bacterium]
MQLGIFAKTFAGSDPALVLGAAKAAGYVAVQFNLACAGLPSLPDQIDDEAGVITQIIAASRAADVSLAALSATYNMAHPDPVKRRAGLKGLETAMRVAAGAGIPLVTLCTGTRHTTDQWAHHPDNAEPSAWADMAAEMALALDLAEAHGVDLGIEPEQANIVQSTADARRLISDMGSARLKIVFDPANLFEHATAAQAREIVARSIAPAAGSIAMVHAKDRYADGRFATAGQGVVDFADLLARIRATGFEGPLVTHGLDASEAPAVARFLRGLLA